MCEKIKQTNIQRLRDNRSNKIHHKLGFFKYMTHIHVDNY